MKNNLLPLNRGVSLSKPKSLLSGIAFFGSVFLTACQSTDNPQQPIPAKPITVTGIARAIDGRLSPNTPVILEQPDKTTLTATTDATGTFKLENVKPPYNLTVFSSAAKRTSLEYQGLSLPNPTVIVPETLVTHILGEHSATVSGAISTGPVDPNATTSLDDLNDPTLVTKLAFASSSGDGQTRASDPSSYSLKVGWHDNLETNGALHALRWRQDSSSGLPSGFLASAEVPNLTLNNATPLTRDLALTPLAADATAILTGTLLPPKDYEPSQRTLSLRWPDGTSMLLLDEQSTDWKFSYNIPKLETAFLTLSAEASRFTGESSITYRTGLNARSSGVNIPVLPAPSLTEPADAEEIANADTTFTWLGFEGGVHLVGFVPVVEAGSSAPAFYALTKASSVKLSEIIPEGFSLPVGTKYQWRVYGFGPYPSIDKAAGGDFLLGSAPFLARVPPVAAKSTGLKRLQLGENPSIDAQIGSSTVRTFTIRP
jgi:hypothetical protein